MHCTDLENPKAKKEHFCDSCGDPITIGQTYYRWRSYDGGDAGTNKMHPECYDMHVTNAEGGEWEYLRYDNDRPSTVLTGAPIT